MYVCLRLHIFLYASLMCAQSRYAFTQHCFPVVSRPNCETVHVSHCGFLTVILSVSFFVSSPLSLTVCIRRPSCVYVCISFCSVLVSVLSDGECPLLLFVSIR